MPHRLGGIDRVALAVGDLAEVATGWPRLGFTLAPRSVEIASGRVSLSVILAAAVIELGEPPGALSWASLDFDHSARSLAAAGLAAGPEEMVARQLELPERTLLLRERRLPLAIAGLPGWVTATAEPQALHRSPWLDHPNGAADLLGATIVVPAPLDLVEGFERLLGAGAVTLTDDIVTLHRGGQRVILVTPDDLVLLHPELDPADIPAPGIALLTLSTPGIERTADHLAQWQVDFEQTGRHGLIVSPSETGGVALEFVPAR